MRLISSRDARHTATLTEAIGRGLAPDGGLYIPETLPRLFGAPRSLALGDVAEWVLQPFFAGDVLAAELPTIVREALNFPAPLVPLHAAAPGAEVLELFHGPTAAFKDFGARFLAGCLAHQRRDANRPLTILVATSGDTGAAVAAAFHRKSWAEVCVLFPKGLVSPRQQQQLTCWDDNVRSFVVRGTFDDCQHLVKTAFLDADLARLRDLSSANSINIGRLLPQVVYYAASSLDVQARTGSKASFIIPSGNLGNAMACVWAREIGLPIDDIVLAHNDNRTVTDYLDTGRWQPRPSAATLASAMDVGDPSNMERLRALFPRIETLRQRVTAFSISDRDIRERIRADFAAYGRVWCPHSATAAEVYARLPRETRERQHWVLVATAHPAKFNEIVEPLIGRGIPVPESLSALLALPSRFQELDAAPDAFARALLSAAPPPPTRVEPVVDRLHGVDVVDPYRWLEGDNSDPREQGRVTPEVAAWTDAQNAHTRATLDGLPGRSALEARLRPLMEIGAVSAPAVRGDRYFFSRREGAQNQPVIYWREGYRGETRTLIDPAILDPSGLTTVEWFSPSRDGRLAAYGTFRAGDENTTLRLMEVDSGRVLPLTIANKAQAAQWLPDGSGFVYHNLAHEKDPYSGRVMFHRLGTDPAGDVALFRQYTKDENEALSTTWGPFGSLSDDGRWLVLGYWIDTQSNDVWLLDFAAFLATGAIDRRPVSIGTTGGATGTVIDDVLYLQTTKGAPRGRLIAAAVGVPQELHWRDVIAERSDAVIEGVSFARGAVAVTYLRNAANVTEVFDLSGRPRGAIAQPGLGATAITTEEDRTDAFLTFTSFNHPTAIFRVDLTAPEAPPELWEQPAVPVDPSSVEVEQVWYRSKDGTKISMFLVHRRGLVPAGSVPTLLNGYGGFNVNETPVFVPTLFQWFEDGGLFALPNLRGGGEYGDAWHEAGMLDRKQNVFDDFIAAAEWLIASGWTTPDRLAITGGSNGGLLTGAAITQRPDLFRVAISAVPLLDMLRYQHFLMARYWVPEYGTAEQADQFPYLYAYSPYHRIAAGTRYPAVLLTAGEFDTRVHALHARKMAARLQAETGSSAADRPVLLWIDRESGHGQGKPLNLRLRDVVDQRIFVMSQLGCVTGT